MAGHNFLHNPQELPKIKTKYRRIVTKLPVTESIETLEKIYKYESHSMHGQIPIVWDRAQGFQVYDKWGNNGLILQVQFS